MEKLFEGLIKFKEKDFLEHKDLFTELGDKQNPHTLFIGCSDSRLVPNLVTRTLPGELFVVRNVANIVPHYRIAEEYMATTSAIEYAVQVLGIKNIVVCGHSNCGGCRALFMPDEFFEKIPNVKKWLELADRVKTEINEKYPDVDEAKRDWLAAQLNIVHQLEHLETYPFIRERVEQGELKIFGWHYIIETGEVFNYNFDTAYFDLLN